MRSRFGASSWRLSFTSRLGTVVALAVGLTVALAAFASYLTVKHELYNQVDSSLVQSARNYPLISHRDPLGAPAILRRVNDGLVQELDSTGDVIASNVPEFDPGAPFIPPSGADVGMAGNIGGYRIDTVVFEGTPYRLLSAGVTINGAPGVLQIGRSLVDVRHTLSTLRLILWLVGFGGLAAAIVLGIGIGRTMVRPVKRLTAAAEYVAATQDLGSTIDDDGRDELGRLARAFNAMLYALASSRRQQAQLISDAGHELRTPLTSLRTNIEVLMRMRDLPETDRADLYGDVEAQLQELTNLIGDLVDLARQEEVRTEPMEARLDDIVSRAVERARRRAPGVSFVTRLTAGSVRAQPALLERAVLNVLDNAAKWSPPEGMVSVTLERNGSWVLEVRDQGPGIAAEDLPHVFDRFYRAASARSMPGSGLGLAIVQQVVTAHGGTVWLSSPPGGGTLVHVELPVVVEAEPEGAGLIAAGVDERHARLGSGPDARSPASR